MLTINPSVGITFTSTVGGVALPFTFGHVFREGDVPIGSVVRVGTNVTQCDIQNVWEDGSAKMAVLSTRMPLVDEVPTEYTLNIFAAPSGPDLDEADLAAALVGHSFEVECGALGSVSLEDLVGTAALLRTRITGPIMSEFHYSASINTWMRIFFLARVYPSGEAWARYTVQNGYIKVSGTHAETYDLKVRVDGALVVDEAGMTQNHHTRVTGAFWISADPHITPKHDTQYLRDTQLVPSYGWTSPAESAFTGLSQTYTPMGLADLPSAMGGAGYSPHIGVLPFWDALYITSNADPRAYNAVIVNAESAGTYSIHYTDENTNRPYAFSDRPNLWTAGPDPVASSTGGTAADADQAHQPSLGYTAYLITGDWHHMEELQYWCTWNGFQQNYVTRQNVKYLLITSAARAVAWTTRNLACVTAITPDGDTLQTEFANSWRSNVQYRWNQYIAGTETTLRQYPNVLGAVNLYSGSGAGDAYTPGNYMWTDAPWMQHFLGGALGFSFGLQVPQQDADSRERQSEFMHFSFQHPVGMLGDASGRPYPYGGTYGNEYGPTATSNELLSQVMFFASWYLEWQQQKIFDGIPSDPPSTPGSPLLGTSGSQPSQMATGYWGNLHPAIAYAVQYNAVGAADAWARFTGASNYASGAATFNNTPQFGIIPYD